MRLAIIAVLLTALVLPLSYASSDPDDRALTVKEIQVIGKFSLS